MYQKESDAYLARNCSLNGSCFLRVSFTSIMYLHTKYSQLIIFESTNYIPLNSLPKYIQVYHAVMSYKLLAQQMSRWRRSELYRQRQQTWDFQIMYVMFTNYLYFSNDLVTNVIVDWLLLLLQFWTVPGSKLKSGTTYFHRGFLVTVLSSSWKMPWMLP